MKGAQHSAKNTAKNISLIVLVVLLGVLCAANWLAGINIAQMPADNPLRRAYDHLFGGAVGYELRSSGVSAAEPAQLALTVDGELYGVQYNLTEIDTALGAVRSLWAQALSGSDLEEGTEEELTAALRAGDCAVLRYHGAIPLGVIAGWMGAEWESDGGEQTVETLVYAAGAERLFVRTPDGALYSAPVFNAEHIFLLAALADRLMRHDDRIRMVLGKYLDRRRISRPQPLGIAAQGQNRLHCGFAALSRQAHRAYSHGRDAVHLCRIHFIARRCGCHICALSGCQLTCIQLRRLRAHLQAVQIRNPDAGQSGNHSLPCRWNGKHGS